MAEVERLEPASDRSIIGRYAERFGMDPDYVFANCRFDTVTSFLVDWKEEREFDDRYSEIEKQMQPKPKK